MKRNFHCSIQKEVCHIMKVFHSPLNQGLKEGVNFWIMQHFKPSKSKLPSF